MIVDFPSLILEVSDRTGYDDIPDRADMFTKMAESKLSHSLRVRQMEKAVTLTADATGAADLPADYVGRRSVRYASCELPERPLIDILGGRVRSYAISGGQIRTGISGASLDLSYYASIPFLGDGANWLITRDPELYLHAVMAQAFSQRQEVDKAMGAMNYVDALVEKMNRSDAIQRFSATTIRPQGVNP